SRSLNENGAAPSRYAKTTVPLERMRSSAGPASADEATTASSAPMAHRKARASEAEGADAADAGMAADGSTHMARFLRRPTLAAAPFARARPAPASRGPMLSSTSRPFE